MQHVTSTFFIQRITRLLLDARDLPRKPVDFHIVLISGLIGLTPDREYTEKEINAQLQKWVLQYGAGLAIDYTSLRRYLVDAGFFSRDSAGTSYQINTSGREISFDPEILDIDLQEVISAARQEKLAKKHQYLARSQDD